MRFEELKGKSDSEQNRLISECPSCSMEEALNNPKLLENKILVFRGNYDGFATNRLCARTFEYLPSHDSWLVSDIILFEMEGTGFAYFFSSAELEDHFSDFCKSTGFIMEL